MKKLIGLKNIDDTFSNGLNELYSNLQDNIKDIKHEYQQNMIDEKIKLLIAICNGEKLDFNEMKIKYLKAKEIENFEPINVNKNNGIIEDNLLDKITIDNIDYYYESINNGIVFDVDNIPIGIYKNGKVIFNES